MQIRWGPGLAAAPTMKIGWAGPGRGTNYVTLMARPGPPTPANNKPWVYDYCAHVGLRVTLTQGSF